MGGTGLVECSLDCSAFRCGLNSFGSLALPVALGIIGLALFRLDWSFMLITILTPVSVAFEDLPGGLGLSLPTEPLIFGLMLVFFYKVFFDGEF